jgi:SAM-dependent methyltransferase
VRDDRAPRAAGAGGASSCSERVVHEGYDSPESARRYAAKTRKGPLRRLSARRESALLLRALRGLPAGSTVLDVPCGAGRLLGPLRDAGHRVAGVDFAAPMLRIARGAGVPLVRASAFALPFASGAFEAVASVRLLHHYGPEDRATILAELARVARTRVVATVFDAASWKHRRRRRKERRRGRASMRFGVGLGEFAAEVRAAGLRPARIRRLLPGYAELAFVVCERG